MVRAYTGGPVNWINLFISMWEMSACYWPHVRIFSDSMNRWICASCAVLLLLCLFPSTVEPVAGKECEFPIGNLGILSLIFDPRLSDREQDSFTWHWVKYFVFRRISSLGMWAFPFARERDQNRHRYILRYVLTLDLFPSQSSLSVHTPVWWGKKTLYSDPQGLSALSLAIWLLFLMLTTEWHCILV